MVLVIFVAMIKPGTEKKILEIVLVISIILIGLVSFLYFYD
jgi:hypothetical protein